MTADPLLLAALFLIALYYLPAVYLPLLRENFKKLLFGGTGAVPGDDPVDHST